VLVLVDVELLVLVDVDVVLVLVDVEVLVLVDVDVLVLVDVDVLVLVVVVSKQVPHKTGHDFSIAAFAKPVPCVHTAGSVPHVGCGSN
jgi:hypothetical protein